MNKIFNYCLIFLFSSVLFPAQYISVDTSTYTPEQLVKDIFIGTQNTSCITVSNVSIKGGQNYVSNPISYGYFEKGTLPFNIENGIILSTGSAIQATGPNTTLLSEGDYSWDGDQDLTDAFQALSPRFVNATSLEFDFVANNTTGISFQYMLLSEEYQFSGCNYFDSFAFLIKEAGASTYKNIALVPGTNEPVSSKTVRGGTDCPENEMYFDRFNYPPDSPRTDSPTNYDGQTKVLTAQTDIIPGKIYHIKLVIADDKTTSHDSAVFLKAGSFVGKKDLGPDLLISTNNAQCLGNNTVLNATTAGATSYQWFKDGVKMIGKTNPILDIAGVTVNNGTYEVEINLGGCQLKGSIRIEFSERPNVSEKKFCNDNNGAPIQLNLQDLNDQFISNYKNYFEVKYYSDSAHTDLLPDNFSYTDDTIIYAQVKSGNCPVVNATLHLNTPKKSVYLVDQTICPNATTTLKAETGFKHYRWMKENGEIIAEGDTLNEISDIPVGKYKVELTSQNDCTMEQEVTVFAAQLPEITNIDVTGNTATVYVSGGNPGYEYSMDGINFTSSSIFTDIPRGLHTMYVRDSKKCEIIEKQFLVINLINVITPNNDGFNDVLDYSDLKIKENVSIEIFDRYGTLVFQSSDKNYIWDGTMNGKALPTGNYWYILNWIEPDTKLPVSYEGWILLKNRN